MLRATTANIAEEEEEEDYIRRRRRQEEDIGSSSSCFFGYFCSTSRTELQQWWMVQEKKLLGGGGGRQEGVSGCMFLLNLIIITHNQPLHTRGRGWGAREVFCPTGIGTSDLSVPSPVPSPLGRFTINSTLYDADRQNDHRQDHHRQNDH